jgi:hypothetical protein
MEQTADAVLRRLKHFVQSQEWPSREEERHLDPRLRELIDLRPFLTIRNGVLGITTKEGGMLPIAPFHLEDALIIHAHHLVGHRAVQATMNILFLRVFLPSGKRKVQQVLQQCQACQRKTDVGRGQRHTYVTVGSSYPFQRISIDFVGPLPLSKNNNTVLLTVKDTFTKWLEAFPLPRATAEAVAKTLESEIFARFGYPDEIHSDQGTQFTGHLMKVRPIILNLTLLKELIVTSKQGYELPSSIVRTKIGRMSFRRSFLPSVSHRPAPQSSPRLSYFSERTPTFR